METRENPNRLTGLLFDEEDPGWRYAHNYDRVFDDPDKLTLAEAMQIAEYYGGGEFDDETGDIVAALCVLRDELKRIKLLEEL